MLTLHSWIVYSNWHELYVMRRSTRWCPWNVNSFWSEAVAWYQLEVTSHYLTDYWISLHYLLFCQGSLLFRPEMGLVKYFFSFNSHHWPFVSNDCGTMSTLPFVAQCIFSRQVGNLRQRPEMVLAEVSQHTKYRLTHTKCCDSDMLYWVNFSRSLRFFLK